MYDFSLDEEQLDDFGALMADLGGYSIIEADRGSGRGLSTTYGGGDMGMVAHRGILRGDEYIDIELIQARIESLLGFTYDEIRTAYAKGRPSATARALRDEIDAELFGLWCFYGNIDELARWIPIDRATIHRAITRAKSVQIKPMVPTGRVQASTHCFKCGSPEGVLRNRETRDARQTKDELTNRSYSMITLCNACYAQRYTRQGHPEYWQFRETRRPSPGHVNSNWAIRAMYERRQKERYA